jgi:hypothetical protein
MAGVCAVLFAGSSVWRLVHHGYVLVWTVSDVCIVIGAHWQTSVGATTQFSEPQFRFTQQTLDTTKLYSTGAAYKLGWNRRMDLALGVQQKFYEAVETVPQFPIQRRSDDPLRAYLSGAEYLTPKLTAYEGYTQGLED